MAQITTSEKLENNPVSKRELETFRVHMPEVE